MVTLAHTVDTFVNSGNTMMSLGCSSGSGSLGQWCCGSIIDLSQGDC